MSNINEPCDCPSQEWLNGESRTSLNSFMKTSAVSWYELSSSSDCHAELSNSQGERLPFSCSPEICSDEQTSTHSQNNKFASVEDVDYYSNPHVAVMDCQGSRKSESSTINVTKIVIENLNRFEDEVAKIMSDHKYIIPNEDEISPGIYPKNSKQPKYCNMNHKLLVLLIYRLLEELHELKEQHKQTVDKMNIRYEKLRRTIKWLHNMPRSEIENSV